MLAQFQAQCSLCGALRDRQLFGTKSKMSGRSLSNLTPELNLPNTLIKVHAVLARPFLAELQSEELGGGCILNNPGLVGSPAFACAYSQVYNDGKFLAVADEEGFISIVDTAAPLPRTTADDEDPKPRAQWLAHKNAVFDIAWAKEDSWMLAASGDQSISLWDTGLAEQLGTFRGHTGSVKSVCSQPGCCNVFASGGRDGVLMVWDARMPAESDGGGEAFHKPVVTMQDAHAPDDKKRKSKARTPLQGRTKPSVTSVVFGDKNTLATGGVDGILKLWDLRYTAAPTAQQPAGQALLKGLASAPLPPIGLKQHGITSLALHPNGVELLVSLTGGHHMIYQLHRPQIGPTKLFGGHTVASFYVKAAFSPDGSHIVSGSTDRKVYIWQVDGGEGSQPYTLSGHEGEVTAVAWCARDLEQIATTADDATVRVWNVKRRDHTVREVRDAPVGLPAWQEVGLLGQPSSAILASPRPRRRSLLAAAASPSPTAAPQQQSQPATPQVASGRRTPSLLHLPLAAVGAGPAVALTASRGGVENGLGNIQQQQQQPRRTSSGRAATPAATAPTSPSAPGFPGAPVWRPASTGARRPRSMAELHATLGSQQKQRKTKQQSIASFLSPRGQSLPALDTGTAGQAASAAAGATTGAGSGIGSPSRSPCGACPAASPPPRNRHRQMPLSPRLQRLEEQLSPRARGERLRVNFDLLPPAGRADAAAGSASSVDMALPPTAGRSGQDGCSSGAKALAPQGRFAGAAAVAALQLEPSPLTNVPTLLQSSNAAGAGPNSRHGTAAGAAKLTPGQQASMSASLVHRQGSVDENAARNLT